MCVFIIYHLPHPPAPYTGSLFVLLLALIIGLAEWPGVLEKKGG